VVKRGRRVESRAEQADETGAAARASGARGVCLLG
jgi:hypothetical protein